MAFTMMAVAAVALMGFLSVSACKAPGHSSSNHTDEVAFPVLICLLASAEQLTITTA